MATYIIQLSIPVKRLKNDQEAHDMGEAILEHLAETFNDDNSLILPDAAIRYYKKGA